MQTYLIVVELREMKGYLAVTTDQNDQLVARVAIKKENASVFSVNQIEELIPEIRSKNPELTVYHETFKEVVLQ